MVTRRASQTFMQFKAHHNTTAAIYLQRSHSFFQKHTSCFPHMNLDEPPNSDALFPPPLLSLRRKKQSIIHLASSSLAEMCVNMLKCLCT